MELVIKFIYFDVLYQKSFCNSICPVIIVLTSPKVYMGFSGPPYDLKKQNILKDLLKESLLLSAVTYSLYEREETYCTSNHFLSLSTVQNVRIEDYKCRLQIWLWSVKLNFGPDGYQLAISGAIWLPLSSTQSHLVPRKCYQAQVISTCKEDVLCDWNRAKIHPYTYLI